LIAFAGRGAIVVDTPARRRGRASGPRGRQPGGSGSSFFSLSSQVGQQVTDAQHRLARAHDLYLGDRVESLEH